jgi:hypothetical protein
VPYYAIVSFLGAMLRVSMWVGPRLLRLRPIIIRLTPRLLVSEARYGPSIRELAVRGFSRMAGKTMTTAGKLLWATAIGGAAMIGKLIIEFYAKGVEGFWVAAGAMLGVAKQWAGLRVEDQQYIEQCVAQRDWQALQEYLAKKQAAMSKTGIVPHLDPTAREDISRSPEAQAELLQRIKEQREAEEREFEEKMLALFADPTWLKVMDEVSDNLVRSYLNRESQRNPHYNEDYQMMKEMLESNGQQGDSVSDIKVSRYLYGYYAVPDHIERGLYNDEHARQIKDGTRSFPHEDPFLRAGVLIPGSKPK